MPSSDVLMVSDRRMGLYRLEGEVVTVLFEADVAALVELDTALRRYRVQALHVALDFAAEEYSALLLPTDISRRDIRDLAKATAGKLFASEGLWQSHAQHIDNNRWLFLSGIPSDDVPTGVLSILRNLDIGVRRISSLASWHASLIDKSEGAVLQIVPVDQSTRCHILVFDGHVLMSRTARASDENALQVSRSLIQEMAPDLAFSVTESAENISEEIGTLNAGESGGSGQSPESWYSALLRRVGTYQGTLVAKGDYRDYATVRDYRWWVSAGAVYRWRWPIRGMLVGVMVFATWPLWLLEREIRVGRQLLVQAQAALQEAQQNRAELPPEHAVLQAHIEKLRDTQARSNLRLGFAHIARILSQSSGCRPGGISWSQDDEKNSWWIVSPEFESDGWRRCRRWAADHNYALNSGFRSLQYVKPRQAFIVGSLD